MYFGYGLARSTGFLEGLKDWVGGPARARARPARAAAAPTPCVDAPGGPPQYPTQALDRKEDWEHNKVDLGTVYRQHKIEETLDRALAEKRAKQGK